MVSLERRVKAEMEAIEWARLCFRDEADRLLRNTSPWQSADLVMAGGVEGAMLVTMPLQDPAQLRWLVGRLADPVVRHIWHAPATYARASQQAVLALRDMVVARFRERFPTYDNGRVLYRLMLDRAMEANNITLAVGLVTHYQTRRPGNWNAPERTVLDPGMAPAEEVRAIALRAALRRKCLPYVTLSMRHNRAPLHPVEIDLLGQFGTAQILRVTLENREWTAAQRVTLYESAFRAGNRVALGFAHDDIQAGPPPWPGLSDLMRVLLYEKSDSVNFLHRQDPARFGEAVETVCTTHGKVPRCLCPPYRTVIEYLRWLGRAERVDVDELEPEPLPVETGEDGPDPMGAWEMGPSGMSRRSSMGTCTPRRPVVVATAAQREASARRATRCRHGGASKAAAVPPTPSLRREAYVAAYIRRVGGETATGSLPDIYESRTAMRRVSFGPGSPGEALTVPAPVPRAILAPLDCPPEAPGREMGGSPRADLGKFKTVVRLNPMDGGSLPPEFTKMEMPQRRLR